MTTKGFNELSKKLEQIPIQVKRNLVVVVKNELIGFTNDMQSRLRAGGADGLHVKEAALSRSVGFAVEGTKLNDIKGVAYIGGVNAPHAWIQEFSGTLRARIGKLLAIPVGAALTKWRRLKESLAGFLRDVPNVSIFKSKKGNIVAVRRFYKSKKSKAQTGEVIAVLKESVFVPARLGFYKTWRARADKRIVAIQGALHAALAWKPGGGA